MQEKMMDNSVGNSDRITRAYIDSLLIETRYMDTADPCLEQDGAIRRNTRNMKRRSYQKKRSGTILLR